jgi:hypothetical protein
MFVVLSKINIMNENKLPVYRKVNDVFERLPNDERNPKRRYSMVNGEYHLEFTDEEEAARDEEERQWESKKPKREAEQLRQEQEFTYFKESLKYEQRIVAFIDILGWQQIIQQSEADEELTKKLGVTINSIQGLTAWKDWMKNNSDNQPLPNDLQISHFSDSVIISVLCDPLSQDTLLFELRSLVSNLLMLGYLVRGGISIGSLIHRGSMVYGSALIKAYELESNKANGAIVPRIVLDQKLSESWGQGSQLVDGISGAVMGFQKNWRLDIDGKRFFDYLQPFPYNSAHKPNSDLMKVFLNPVRELILSNLSTIQPFGVLLKYIWLANYFNSILDEYPESEIEKISIP